MSSGDPYTASELLAVMSSRLLKDGQMVFAGVGIPLLAATLAQPCIARASRSCSKAASSGRSSSPASCRPRPTNSAAPSAPTWCSAAPTCCCSCSAAMSMSASWAARRSISTAISTPRTSAIRRTPRPACPGTGGGNDISSLTQMIVAMKHEKRRFVEPVDFVTSPGFLRGGTTRRDSGLLAGGMYPRRHRSRRFSASTSNEAHEGARAPSGATLEQVQDNTAFELAFDDRYRGDRAPDRARARLAAQTRSRASLHCVSRQLRHHPIARTAEGHE